MGAGLRFVSVGAIHINVIRYNLIEITSKRIYVSATVVVCSRRWKPEWIREFER